MTTLRMTAALLALTFVSPTTSEPQLIRLQGPTNPVPGLFFGLHIHQAGSSTPWPPFPVFAWRLWDASVTWNYLQARPDQWNFKLLDKYVELAEQHHTEILLTLGYTPQWAASRPEEVSSSGMHGVASHPADVSTWREYVRNVATRYKGRIHIYEIWNEANLSGYYSGTVEQMVTLAKEAYTVLKEVDKSNTVISPSGMGLGSNIVWLDDFLKGGGKYCDVIAYHFYVTPAQPERMLNVIQEVKEVLRRHGINKPLWNTESGWSMDKKFVGDDERMGYLARAYILNWAAGIERFYWYAYDNYTWTSLPLTLPDRRTLNSAGKAYGTLQSWLIGSHLESCERDQAAFWTCRLIRKDGSTAWIMWASAQSGGSSVPQGCCRNMEVHYLDGRLEVLGNMSTVVLGAAPVLVEDKKPT